MSVDFPPATTVRLPERTGARGTPVPAIDLAVHEAGDGPAVVLCHGFPELAYSWRHQLAPLAQAGFRAIAPDQRGYGGSDAPAPVDAYDLEQLTADLAGLLDALEIERAVFVGHDWGGFVVWAMPVLYPERTAGVVGVNTPYMPFPTTDQLRGVYDDDQLYILWFQEPGVAEAVMDQHVHEVFDKFVRRGRASHGRLGRDDASSGRDRNLFKRIAEAEPTTERLLTPAELDRYVEVFERTGFRGAINWYRNIDRNREHLPEVGTVPIDVPCLMIAAEWDPALPPALAEGMRDRAADFELHVVAECGHWTQQERPDEVNRLLVDWLRRRFA